MLTPEQLANRAETLQGYMDVFTDLSKRAGRRRAAERDG